MVIAEKAVVPDHAAKDCAKAQDTQRDQHDHRGFVGVIMRMVIAARLAEEGHEHQAPAIETGEHRRDDQHPEAIARAASPSGFDNRVLGQEASETKVGQRDADAGDGQRTDHHRPERIGQLFAQSAIVPHVLFVVHPVDHRTRAKEQHRLKESMRQQVEHRDGINAHTGSHEHVAQLRTGGICDDALDVVLHQAHGRSKERGRGTDENNHLLRLGRVFEQRRHAANKEHTGGDHGRGVDQRGHRCRAFHRVGQPRVQEQLGGFTHRTNEQQHANQVRGIPFGPQEMDLGLRDIGHLRKDVSELDRVRQEEQAKDTKGKAEVTHTVDDKRLDRCGVGGRLAVVEANQKVGRNAHAFPAKEHLDQVVGGDQHQHGEGKERQIRKEARAIRRAVFEVVVMRHVAKGIQVHERGDRRDHDQHRRGQTVQTDRPVGRKRAGFDPAQHRDVARDAIKAQKHDPRQERGQEQQTSGHPLRRLFANDPPRKAADQGPDQRCK